MRPPFLDIHPICVYVCEPLSGTAYRVVLPRYSQSRQLRTPAATATATATAASPPASASASTPTLSAEVAALVAQNEELKASLLQMRKRNAQVPWSHIYTNLISMCVCPFFDQLRTNMAAGQVTTGGPNASQRRGSVSQQRRSGSPIPATALDRSSGDQWADEDDHDNYEGKKVGQYFSLSYPALR